MTDEKSRSESYEAAGVDITAGYKAVELMKKHIARTSRDGMLEGVGGFGGLFQPNISGMKQPVLVSGTDGVGTKLKVAILSGKHDTIGIDCVAMCVNDIICCGAEPLFFLDYIALGKNIPEKVADIVSGVCEGCVQAGCALIGGETAEMPGMYDIDDYDLAGFCVGMVDKEKLINKDNVKEGDVIIGIASSGVHSNGYSLVRKIFDVSEENLKVYYDELGKTLAEELLTPTKIYVKAVRALLSEAYDENTGRQSRVNAIAHITGGGFYENIPRSLPEGLSARIDKNSFDILPVFKLMMKKGNISERDMFNTFNMGIGMAVVVSPEFAEKAVQIINGTGEKAYIIGEVISSDERIIIS